MIFKTNSKVPKINDKVLLDVINVDVKSQTEVREEVDHNSTSYIETLSKVIFAVNSVVIIIVFLIIMINETVKPELTAHQQVQIASVAYTEGAVEAQKLLVEENENENCVEAGVKPLILQAKEDEYEEIYQQLLLEAKDNQVNVAKKFQQFLEAHHKNEVVEVDPNTTSSAPTADPTTFPPTAEPTSDPTKNPTHAKAQPVIQ